LAECPSLSATQSSQTPDLTALSKRVLRLVPKSVPKAWRYAAQLVANGPLGAPSGEKPRRRAHQNRPGPHQTESHVCPPNGSLHDSMCARSGSDWARPARVEQTLPFVRALSGRDFRGLGKGQATEIVRGLGCLAARGKECPFVDFQKVNPRGDIARAPDVPVKAKFCAKECGT
jgi:hypothetical protein